jgi:hypothetical protein
MIIRSDTDYIKVTLIRNPANRSNDFATLSRCSSGEHPARVSRYFDFAGKRKVSPLFLSAYMLSRSKFMPILLLKHCSSGSITKSIHFPDFWSTLNEEPLDENRLSGAKELFLFAHPIGRARGCLRP